MEDEQEPMGTTDATDLYAELRAHMDLEALGEGRMDSVALGIPAGTDSLSEEEYLDLSGD